MLIKKIVRVTVGVVGFCAAVFGIVQGFREFWPRIPKLQAAILNVEHVSARTEIPGVKISLAFKDQAVSDLWLCRIRFQNIGGATLYTTGPRPNTQGPVVVAVPENYEILQVEPKGVDPKDSGFEAVIRQSTDANGSIHKHQLEVMFQQWRKGEAIEAVLYLAALDEHRDRLKLIPKGRPILDGDVVPSDLSLADSVVSGPHSILDRAFSPFWARCLKIFAFLTLSVFAMVLVLNNSLGKLIMRMTLQERHRGWSETHPERWELLQILLALAVVIAMAAIAIE